MTPTRLTLKSFFPCIARFINSPNFFFRSYTTEVKCKKLMIYEFGDPAKVVKLEEENIKPPGSNEVLIEMIVASMNPADMNTIQGTYPIKPKLPGVPGQEGVGKVIATGAGVNDFFIGDLVIPNIENFGTWRTHNVVPSSSVLKVPINVPLIELSGISSNTSTAYRMLKDFVPLSPGDCVLQNGANSAAGQNVIQFCKAWGYKSVNIVRNRPDIDKLKNYLIGLGATHVLTEEELRSTQLFKSGEVPSPKLALNCVGGKSASEVMRRLSQKGVVVTYGGMSREPVIIPTSLLIFKDISAKGFWMTRWTKENRDSEVRKYMFSDIMNLIVAGKLKAPAHSLIPLSKYSEALQNISNPKGFTGTKYIIDFRLEKS